MKRNLSLLLSLTAVLLLFFSACNRSGGGSGSGEKVQLTLNVKAGDVQKIHYTMDQTISQKIMGMTQRIAQKTEMFIKQEVVSVDEKGIATVNVTYERVKASMENAITGKQSYDSNEGDDDSPLSAGYGKMVGKTFTMFLDKQYRVTDVTGLEDLMGDLFESEDGTSEEEDQMKKALKSTLGPEAMKRNLQQMALIFPEELVGEGDTWGEKYELAGEFGLGAEYTYKVENIDADKVILAVDAEIKTRDDASIDMGIMAVEYKLTGEQGGTMELNRASGWMETAELNQDLKGEFKASGMTIPMTITSKVTIEPY